MRFPFFSFLLLCLAFSLARLPANAQGNTPVEIGTRGVSNFLRHIETKKEAHVAFIGGSITEKDTGHVQVVGNWLKKRWPEVDFTITNAGLSSTCSVSGAFRLKRDVLSQGPVDLLIVEFAVNDDQDAAHDHQTAVRGLEGILRQYFKANPKGDVISVQFVNPSILAKYQAGEVAVSVAAHKKVARHYGIPIVDVGFSLSEEIKSGSMTWKEDYGGTHPNSRGYTFAGNLITKVIEQSVNAEKAASIVLPGPIDPSSYSGVYSIDPQEFAWLGGWRHEPVSRDLLPLGQIRSNYEKYKGLRSDEAGNYLYGAFQGTMLGAFVLAGPDAGILEVSIDAGEWKSVDLFHRYSGGLNYPRSVILADNLSNQFHTFAIRISGEKNPKSKGSTATFLHFHVNR